MVGLGSGFSVEQHRLLLTLKRRFAELSSEQYGEMGFWLCTGVAAVQSCAALLWLMAAGPGGALQAELSSGVSLCPLGPAHAPGAGLWELWELSLGLWG